MVFAASATAGQDVGCRGQSPQRRWGRRPRSGFFGARDLLDQIDNAATQLGIFDAHECLGQRQPIGGRQEVGDTADSPVDVRLRSANELGGYDVTADDGEVGQVMDLLVDDDLSRILFLVIEVKAWLFGKKVLAGPSLISRVDWATSTVHVNANRQALKNAHEYNPAA